MYYLDSHAHLTDEAYENDIDEVIKRMDQANIQKVLIITLSHEELLKALPYVQKDPSRYQIATGLFPIDVAKVTEEVWKVFEQDAKRDEVSVIGEIGLDYYWEKDPTMKDAQRNLFIKQINLAKALNKPIAVHSRDAMQDTFDIMKEHHHKGLLHCFPGTKEMAKEFTKLGYYIALGGALTFKNARHSVEVMETIDLNYILCETDCPYMSPEPVRGTRNEPSNIPYIVAKMASIRNLTIEQMQNILLANYNNFLQ